MDPAGVGDGVNSGVATTIADEGEAPAGVTFSHPTDYESGLVIGDLGPGQCQAIWIRRTVNAGAAATASNSFQIKVQGQTA